MNTLEQPYYVTMIWSSKLCPPRSFIQRYEMSDPAFVRRCLVIFRIVWTTYHKRHPEEVQVFAHVQRSLTSQYAISHLPEEVTWSSTLGPNLSQLFHSMNLSYTLHVHGFLLVYCQIGALNQRLVVHFKRVNWPLLMVNLLSLIFYLVSLSNSSTGKRLKTPEFIDSCYNSYLFFKKLRSYCWFLY